MALKFNMAKMARVIIISMVCLGFISQSQLFAFGKTGTALEQLGFKAGNDIQKSFDIPIPLFIKNIVGDETRKYKSEKGFFTRRDAERESKKVEKVLYARDATLLEIVVMSHGVSSYGFIVKYISNKSIQARKYESEKGFFTRRDAERESKKVEEVLYARDATLLETVIISHGPSSASFTIKYISNKSIQARKYESEKGFFARSDAERESKKVEEVLYARGATLLETVIISHDSGSASFTIKYID